MSTKGLTAVRGAVQAKLPEGVQAIDKARTHARLELHNDVDTIMPTITQWDTNFAVVAASSDLDFDLLLVQEPDAVREWYEWQDASIVRHAQYRVTEYNHTWFQVTEQLADLTSKASGDPVPCHVVVLFATWADGIIGEVAYSKPPWGDRALDEQSLRSVSRRLDAYDRAWETGDVDARMATFGPRTCSVIRTVEVDGDRRHRVVARTNDELRDAYGAPAEGRVIELERWHQIITGWYAFAFYTARIDLGDRTVERETARLMLIGPELDFLGELTYSMETVDGGRNERTST